MVIELLQALAEVLKKDLRATAHFRRDACEIIVDLEESV